FVGSDRVAHGLQPGPDDDLRDRLARRGHLDVSCHVRPSLWRERSAGSGGSSPLYSPKASSTSIFCSMRCAAPEPVAGLADSGRDTPLNARPATSLPHRTRRCHQAPMLEGSSWT